MEHSFLFNNGGTSRFLVDCKTVSSFCASPLKKGPRSGASVLRFCRFTPLLENNEEKAGFFTIPVFFFAKHKRLSKIHASLLWLKDKKI